MSASGVELSTTEQACLVRVAGRTFAVPIVRAREVRVFETYTRVPLAPRHLIGMVNLRGGIVPIVDLRLLLGHPAQPAARRIETVVAEADGTTVALAVDQVIGIEALETAAGDTLAAETVLARGAFQRGEDAIPVLDITAIVSALAVPSVRAARQEVR